MYQIKSFSGDYYEKEIKDWKESLVKIADKHPIKYRIPSVSWMATNKDGITWAYENCPIKNVEKLSWEASSGGYVKIVPPPYGGCWFCHTVGGDMRFDNEFDAYIHPSCLRHFQKEKDIEALLIPEEKEEKPPLGVKPEYIHNGLRVQELKEAIIRYLESNRGVPLGWITEYNKLIITLQGGKND